jgi:hypothetical protein
MADVRLIAKHSTILDPDYHEWVIPERSVRLDKIGRRRSNSWGTTSWFKVRCNNPACPGEALLREGAVTTWMAGLLAQDGSTRG